MSTIVEEAPPPFETQWQRRREWPEDSIGRLMEPPSAVFPPDATVDDVVAALRPLVGSQLITYCYVVDLNGKLLGVVTMRDLLFARREQYLAELMLVNAATLSPTLEINDAMRKVVNLHFPVYPVCDDERRLVGLIRGHVLFEEREWELTAQAGEMVGVTGEERHSTPWRTSLAYRHPWLQLNLLTAFLAALVVGIFEDTIAQIVLLAVFLPVLAGQSGNTGCQALAVAIRGLTLGDLKPGTERSLIHKEGLLGLLNGALVGVVAGGAMFAYASWSGFGAPLALGFIVFFAMVGSCVISGISGALIPLGLKRLGADPATASSIFLTTATDVVSMGMLLGLATVFLL
ncbi:MAG: magnesium transporter [Xanthomonadaceae bacterium]|nr:magnesium transporter [Xanthomonadaceae bacterium]